MFIAKKVLYYFSYTIVILFLATVCVSIIFYASGYRLNTKAKKIQKTGILILDCHEDDIKILIDNKEVEVKKNIIPHIISAPYALTLIPGEYSLEVQKEGKIPFKDQVMIESELITKIEDIKLFPEKIEEEIVLEEEIYNYAISPDNKKIIYTDKNNQVQIYDIEKREINLLSDTFSTSQTISFYTWSPNSKKVILKITNPKSIFHYTIEIDNPQKSYFLHEKFSFVPFFEKIIFSNKNPNELFGLADNTLYSINITSLSMDVIEKNVSNLLKNNDYLYYHQKDENQIIQFDTNIYKKTVLAENITPSNNFEILPLNKDQDIYIKNSTKIYFIENKDNLNLIDESVDDLFISKDKKSFYYTKGYELWFYDKNKKESNFITRFSKKINDLREYDNEYLIYTTNQSIEIIRKDNTNNIVVKDNIKTILLKIIDKNKMLIVEQKETLKKFIILDL